MFNRDLFKDFTRADAIKRQEDREKLRVLALDSKRNAEHAAIIEAPGEGCALCIDGAKSVGEASQIDICREVYAYLPVYMDINNQRPSWCPGFARNGIGLAADTLPHQEQEQQELPL